VHEHDDTWGLSHFLEHMVFRGTRSHRDARAVALAADAFGGEIEGATYRDRVIYDTRLDPDALDDAMQLLTEIAFAPRLSGLETERRIIREELLETLDDDGQEIDADNVAFAHAFPGHPLGRSIDGTLDSLASFDDDRVRDFHRAAYGVEHMVVVAAGPFAHAAVVKAARRAVGERVPGKGPPPGAGRGGRRPRGPLKVVRTDSSQTTVRLVFRTPGIESPARASLAALSRVLDDGPSSRFQTHLIDHLGLAYELWASADFHEEHGVLEVGAQVAHNRVGELMEAVAAELARVKRRTLPSAELERVKARHARDLLDMRDAPAHTAERIGRAVLFGLEPDPLFHHRELLAVDEAAIRARAREVLRSDNATLVLVGRPPRADVARAEAALGSL